MIQISSDTSTDKSPIPTVWSSDSLVHSVFITQHEFVSHLEAALIFHIRSGRRKLQMANTSCLVTAAIQEKVSQDIYYQQWFGKGWNTPKKSLNSLCYKTCFINISCLEMSLCQDNNDRSVFVYLCCWFNLTYAPPPSPHWLLSLSCFLSWREDSGPSR